MKIFDRLKSIFVSSADADPDAFWLHVRCARCGTPLAVRVDLRNETSPDYERGGYVLHKDMMDDKCFTLMHAEIHFDAAQRIVEERVDKGEMITPEQYTEMTSAKQKTSER